MPKTCTDVVTSPNGNPLDCLNCRCVGCGEYKDPYNANCDLYPEHGCPKYPLIPEPEKWSYNFTEDGLWDNEVFETGEEAYEAGKAEALDRGGDTFYNGQLVPITISSNAAVDVDGIFDLISQQLDDEYGSDFEHGERWYDAITSDDKLTLEEMLNAAFHEWLQKTSNQPTSLTIIDIDEYCKTANTWVEKLSTQKAKRLSEKLGEDMLNEN